MKYEYKFEKIGIKCGLLKRTPKQDYHNIITKYAENGWRFVQIFARPYGYGAASFFELIFERTMN